MTHSTRQESDQGIDRDQDVQRLPVVVVGAGMAGLSAARSLQDHGIPTIVVEGANRIGGRLHTVDLQVQGTDPSTVDLGAAWIHGPIGNPLASVAADAGVTGYPTTFSDNPAGLLVKSAQGNTLDPGAFSLGNRAFWNAADSAYETGKALGDLQPDRSFAEAIDEEAIQLPDGLDSAAQDGFRFAHAVGLQGHEASDLNDLSFDGYDYDTRPGGDILLADGGYRALVDHVAKGLSSVRLNTLVSAIHERNGRYVVQVSAADRSNDESEQTIDARAVIVTASIGVLQSGTIDFDPPLPEPVTSAIANIGMGANEKVAIAFESWPWDRDLGYAVLTDTDDTDPYVSWLLRSDSPIAVSYSGGTRARTMSAQADDEVLDAALKSLRHLFGPLPEVTDWQRTSWIVDPLIRGSYSFNMSRASNQARALLSAPVRPGLILAGEAMNTSDYGTAHGALIAGRRAADQLVAGLT